MFTAFISQTRAMRSAAARLGVLVLGLCCAAFSGSGAWAQTAAPAAGPPSFACGGFGKGNEVVLKPVPKLSNGEFTDAGADCAMWQTFFYLNWPALAGKRGIPNTSAKFGAPGTTVWETFKTSEQVFLPNGAAPTPWDTPSLAGALPSAAARQVSAGQMRLLNRTSKVSAAVTKLRASSGVQLDETQQFDGHVLYDQQKQPVYYDVAMNQTQFDYIASNGLYNANTQVAFSQKKNIVLPSQSLEVKAAWKVLTPGQASSGRFHTAPGFIPSASGGAGKTVTVGLVGMHVFASGGDQGAGLWATFYQIDNAPLAPVLAATTGNFSFYNPTSSSPINTTNTNPTQLVQMIPDTPTSVQYTQQAQKIIKQGNPAAPWQYYAMVDTQWSKSVLDFTSPIPTTAPLKAGSVSTATLVNPVLETFKQTKGTSCLGCHSFATTAQPNSKTATGFSFLFGNAQAPKKP